MSSSIIISIVIVLAGFTASWFSYRKNRIYRLSVEKKEQETNRRMYELAILKELGERIGYSLDAHQIIDVITGSLHQFIEYSAVSYMLIDPERIIFNVHLEKSVSRGFIDEVKKRMLGSLSALLDKEFKPEQVKEVLSGAILVSELETPIKSFFNIPLVIGGKVVGVLTVTHTEAGLYKEEEMTILYKITNQASQAVTRLQAVVKTEQSKLNAMVESMADGVVMTDKDYRILVINPSAKNTLGLKTKKEVTIFDLIDNLGGIVDIHGRLEESVKLKKTYVSERVFIKEKFYQVFVFPVLAPSVVEGDDVLGGVVIFHDITREIEVEKIRDDFTSMLVHELRSPLDSIKKISESLRTDNSQISVEERLKYLQMIYQNSGSMLGLVNNILDVAKIESGKFEIFTAPSDIVQLVESRINFFKLQAVDQKIALEAHYGPGLPKSAIFDAESIKEVLNNLISNGMKFIKEGGAVNVTVFRHEASKSVSEEVKLAGAVLPIDLPEEFFHDVPESIALAVSDNGIGIPASEIGQLFTKFKQLSNNGKMPRKKGTGLGLAVVKGVVEQHKGKVGVVSSEGKGSVFFFVIPLLENVAANR